MTAPLWADADEIERRFWDADPQRHDVERVDGLWPEVVDDRCRICGQVVESGLVECNLCFEISDAAYERRLDV